MVSVLQSLFPDQDNGATAARPRRHVFHKKNWVLSEIDI
jgi:hypothetical protein